jgi:O-methyltransferase
MGILNKILGGFGWKLVKEKDLLKSSIDMDENTLFMENYNKCMSYTMTSKERMFSLSQAIQYIETNNIEGDIVECGVWKGGSSMMAALSLNLKDRKLFLYDTFEGMNEPSENDKNMIGEDAANTWDNRDKCEASIFEVKKNMAATNYPEDKIRYIKGMVEDTIPAHLPEKISILRLDTDWYESTLHELKHLYPLLSSGGVLIIDDYGHWQGAKKAVDEYISDNKLRILLNRIDYTGRIAIKG